VSSVGDHREQVLLAQCESGKQTFITKSSAKQATQAAPTPSARATHLPMWHMHVLAPHLQQPARRAGDVINVGLTPIERQELDQVRRYLALCLERGEWPALAQHSVALLMRGLALLLDEDGGRL